MAEQFIFDANGSLIGVYDGPSVVENSTPLRPLPGRADGVGQSFKNGVWAYDTVNLQVSRLEFMQLFTGAERVAIKKARAIDDLVEDFFSMVEDPDATGVDLTLPSTENALFHLEGLGILSEERHQQILAGTPQ